MELRRLAAALEDTVLTFIESVTAHKNISIPDLRIVLVASVSHSLLRTGRTMTKRDLYYLCRPLFKSSTTAARTLEKLACMLHVPTNDLNIVAAPKGIVSGPMSYIGESNEQVCVAGFGSEGALIPSRPERLRALTTSARLVLVVEKETAFEALVVDPNFQRLCGSWLVVTGKGYPDHATRNLIKRLVQTSRNQGKTLPVHILTDADPHGIAIAVCYARALESQGVHWAGVHPSHRDRFFKIPALAEQALTARERKLAGNLLAECNANMAQFGPFCQDIVRELSNLLESGIKFEIEAITSSAALDASSPLLNYVQATVCRAAR